MEISWVSTNSSGLAAESFQPSGDNPLGAGTDAPISLGDPGAARSHSTACSQSLSCWCLSRDFCLSKTDWQLLDSLKTFEVILSILHVFSILLGKGWSLLYYVKNQCFSFLGNVKSLRPFLEVKVAASSEDFLILTPLNWAHFTVWWGYLQTQNLQAFF